jgi:hypothetical protein
MLGLELQQRGFNLLSIKKAKMMTPDSIMSESTHQKAWTILLIFSYCRVFFPAGILGLMAPTLVDVVFIIIGLISHLVVYPYFGFNFYEFKTRKDKDSFIPLKRWMVSGSYRKLKGDDYKNVMAREFSPLGLEKLESIENTHKISIYDKVNLMRFELQTGIPNHHK